MARRLIDQDPRREQRRQSLMLDRLQARYQAAFGRELARAMRDAARVYADTGEVVIGPEHEAALQRIFEVMAVDAAMMFGGRVMQQGKDAGLALETKDFAQTMAAMAIGYVRNEIFRRKITSIANTTRQQITNAVAAGYAEGLGQRAIGQYILDRVPQFSQFRANLIARTETHGAAQFGAMVAADQTGLTLQKEWISAEDERTREDHQEANGQIVGRDEPFIVGGEELMFPGDPSGSPEQVINCFAPWSLISTAGLKGAMRREYSGDLVKLTLACGANITVTPNHPILTDLGWVPAGRVMQGDKLVYSRIADVRPSGTGLNVCDAVSRADDLYNAAQTLGSCVRLVGVVVDLHGEMPAHDVDVVAFQGELRDAFKASGLKLFGNITLADADIAKGALLADRMIGLSGAASADKADSLVSGLGSRLAILGGGHSGGAAVAFADAGLFNAEFDEASIDEAAPHPDGFCDAVDAITCIEHFLDAGQVAGANLRPSGGDVAFQIRQVASVETFHYDGPVFNFESDTGILISSGIVNHNCRCVVAFVVAD